MADLFYYETGYIDEKYFSYVADGAAQLAPYFEDGYIEASYYEDFGATSSLTCEATKTSGQTVEGYSDWSASFTQSATATRFVPAASSLTIDVTQSASAGKIIDDAITIDSAWTSSITAIAFKNHTAVLDTATTLTVDAVANKSANVLLEHIADLNAMAAKTAVIDSDLTITSTQTSSATALKPTSSSLSTTSLLSISAGKLKIVESSIDSQTNIFTNKYLGWLRPRVTWTGSLSYIQDGTDIGYGNFGASKYGSYSAWNGFTYGSRSSPYTNSTNPDWDIDSGEEFALEFHIRRTDGTIANNPGSPAVSMGSYTTTHNWSDETTSNIAWSIGLYYNSTGENSGKTQWKFRYNNGSSLVDINSSTLSNFNSLLGLVNEDTWYHIAVNRGSDGIIRLYINGTQVGSSSYSGAIKQLSGVNRFGINASHIYSSSTSQYKGFFDELSYKVGSSAITTGSTVGNNDGYIPYQQLLLHFENAGTDDLTLTASAQTALSVSFVISTQADGNTKQGLSSLTSSYSISASGFPTRDFNSQLTSTASLSTNAGKLLDIDSNLTTTADYTIDYTRTREFEATEYVAFTSGISAVATKVGETVLSSSFALAVEANSYSEVPASISAAFAIIANANADQVAESSISGNTTISFNGGKLKVGTASINGAMSFSVTAIALEGSLIPLTASSSLSVTGKRLRFGIANSTVNVTQTANVRANLAIWDITDYEILPTGFTVDFQWKFSSNVPDSYNPLINFGMPGNANLNYGYPVTVNYANGGGDDRIFVAVQYLKKVGTNQYQEYIYEGQWTIAASVTNGLSTGTWRDFSVSASVSSSGVVSLSASFPVAYTSYTTSESSGTIHNMRIIGNPNYVIFAANDAYTGNGTTIRNVDYQRTGFSYAIPYPQVTGADLREMGSSITATPLLVIFFESNQSSTFTQTASAVKTSRTNVGLSTSATLTSTPGFKASAYSNLSTLADVSSSLSRSRVGSASLTTTATLTAAVNRTRDLSSSQPAAFTQTAIPVKKTGNIINASSTFSQSTIGYRVRYNSVSISALHSELTVAAKNATGTVLLETTSTLTATPVKNGDLPASISATFTQTVETRKIVGFESTLSSQAAIEADGQRIQPAGADITADFALTATTTNSKITRVSSSQSSTATLSASAQRFRGGISLEAGAFTLVCDNKVLRQAQATLTDSFTILASPQFIVRINAELTGFYSSLTVGDVINIDPYYKLVIKPEGRGLQILPESRIIAIEQETRVNII